MWKKEDGKPQGVAENSTTSVSSSASSHAPTSSSAAVASATPSTVSPRSGASISQGIRIKGEVTGSEDLFIDGVVEGKLNLANGSLTIGPHGQVKADVNAREVIVHGQIEGKVSGRDKVALLGTGQINGEVQTERLAIEEGASLRGRVEAGKLTAKGTETRTVAAAAGTSTKASEAHPSSVSSGTAN
jgi:cytoskeletal protein CcmA (bactofilin family)